MHRHAKIRLATIALGAGALISMSCGGAVPGAGGLPGTGSGSVDPNSCGNYAVKPVGAKLKRFLEATVALEVAVKNTENYVKDSCALAGKELGMGPETLNGNTSEVCKLVINEMNEHRKVGLKAEAKLTVDYKPAVCTVDIDAAASFAAKCEAKAEADVSVRCSGTCSGTCSGKCDGTCSGSAGTGGSGGQCDGQCSGRCEGSCSGGCEGNAEVEASASCRADAEVHASVKAECTEPEVNVDFSAEAALDTSKLEALKAAFKAALPRLLKVKAQMTGPMKAAFNTWAKAGKELVKAGRTLVGSLDDQAMCVLGQLKAAVGMFAGINASIEVQVEVSASMSASAG